MNLKLTNLFLLFILLSSTLLKAGNPKLDSIRLTGIIFNDKQVVKNLVIKVYDENTLIKVVKVDRRNKFTTNIPLNKNLTVEINSESFHTKRFLFDTHIPQTPKIQIKYQFDIDLFKESEIAGVNTSMLDFRVGLVSYDEKKKMFVRDKKFTKRMKKTYLGLWTEAQKAERQGKGLE